LLSDATSASSVPAIVQDGLFFTAVFNSCINPLVYGSFYFKSLKTKWQRKETAPIAPRSNQQLNATNPIASRNRRPSPSFAFQQEMISTKPTKASATTMLKPAGYKDDADDLVLDKEDDSGKQKGPKFVRRDDNVKVFVTDCG